MIRRLTLENWRAYESAAVGFEPGTTFVVAPNGIGKTSLLEAAKFALTGGREDLSSPVQLDADVARVELTLQLPSARVLIIRRELFADPAKEPTFTASLGNDELTEASLAAEIDAVFGASPGFIGRNAFLSDSLRDGGPLDLRSQLSRAFGLDVKRADAERLKALAAEREEEAKQLGRAIKSEARELARTEADFDEAQDAVATAEAQLVVARAGLQEAEAKRQYLLQNEVMAERLQAWERATATVVDAARAFVPDVTADRLVDEVERLVAAVEAETSSLQTRFTTVQARLELIESALGELLEADAECPVCLRPLDDHDREAAEAEHRAEAARLAAEMETMDVAAAAARYQEVRALMRRADGLGPRPDAPDAADDTGEHSQEVFDRARTDLEEAAGVHSAAVARATQLAEALVEAYDAEARAAESVSAWRRWALTAAASSTLTDTIDEVLANEVEPLAAKVGERWNTLFADRPDLRFDLDGDLWREFRGHRLGIDAFSAGEQMSARLLMQLAILTSATRVRFCWVDEPLERLDPRTRRLVAGLLSHGRTALGLRQLVVTTYEEELAQRLSEADETTTVQYVRAGTP
jgi:DNA repair exonuclease SbcCD ATPase subunit